MGSLIRAYQKLPHDVFWQFLLTCLLWLVGYYVLDTLLEYVLSKIFGYRYYDYHPHVMIVLVILAFVYFITNVV